LRSGGMAVPLAAAIRIAPPRCASMIPGHER